MKKRLLLIIFTLLFLLRISGQTTFQLNYNYDGFDIIGGVKSIPTGYVAAGWGYGSVNFSPVGLALETDTVGNIVWAKRYVGPGFIITDPVSINDMQKLSGGGYIVTGGVGSYAMLIKLSSAGTTVWGSGGGRRYRVSNEWGNGVKETAAGDLVVAGGSSAKSMNPNKDSTSIYVFKANSGGTYQWGRSYTLTSPVFDSHDAANDVVEVSNEYYFVGYHSEQNGADTTTNILLFKTDANGNLQWMRSYGELGKNESGYGIQYLSSNELLIVGYTDKTSSAGDVALIKTDLSGNITFSAAYNVGGLGVQPGSLLKTSDGGYAISGWVITNIFPLTIKSFLLKLNSSFGVQFTKQYSGLVGSFFTKSDITNDGGYIVGTMSGGQTSWDAHLIKTDANGVSGCNENNFTATQQTYSPPANAIVPTVHTGGNGSNFTPAVSNISPSKTTDCLISNCSKPSASISPSSIAICQGSSTTLTASGGGTYQWSTGETTASISVSTAGSYTVTVTASGCDSVPPSATVSVNSNPAPAITASGPTSFCSGGSVTLTADPASSYSWSNGAITQSINVNSSGSYAVTVTYSNGCSNSSSPTTVTVNNNPAPAITAGGATTFCEGGSVTLTSSAANSYLWSDGSTAQSINVTASGTYNVTVTDGNGCTGSAGTSTTVTVNQNPAPAITGANSVCSNSSGTYSVTNNPGNSYTWAISNGTINSGQGTNSVSVTWNASGAADISITETNNSTTCTGSDILTVTINSSLDPTITASGPASICQGDTVILDAGSGYTSYLWNTTETTQTISVTAAGAYSVSVTDANGCSGSSSTPVSITVNNNPTPVITVNGSAVVCEGDSVMLDGGAGYSAYLWSTGGTSQTIYADSAGSYSLTVTDSNGCTGSSSSPVNIDVISPPVVTVTTSDSTVFCDGDSIILDAGSGYSSYLWNTGESSQAIVVVSSGNYSVSVTDANGCSNDSSATSTSVTVNPLPAAAISGNAPVCSGDTVFLIASGGISYQWSTGAIDTALPVTAGGTYMVTVTDTNSCFDIDSVLVTIYPSYSIPLSADICEGDSILLGGSYQTASGIYADTLSSFDGCDSILVTSLTVNPAYSNSVSLSICSGDSVFLEGSYQTATGTYYDTLSSANGCDSIVATALSVDPVYSVSLSGTICSGDSIFLQGSYQTLSGTYYDTLTSVNGCDSVIATMLSVNQSPGLSITSSSSSICEGDLASLCVVPPGLNPQWNNGMSVDCITVSPAGSTLFSVTVTDANSCSNSDSVLISVTPVPVPFIAGDSITCSNESLALTASGGTSYLWSTGDTDSVAVVNPYVDSTFYVTVSNGNCSADDSVFVTVLPAPDVSNAGVSPDTTIHFGDKAALSATGNGSYAWFPGDHLSCTDCANPVAGPDSTTVYYLTVTAANGCTFTDSVIVIVDYPAGEVFVPNIFSPNGDGQNDVLFVYGRYIDKIELYIYDRWGEKVFETTDKTKGWDGTYKGKLLNTAVFAYYLKAYLSDGAVYEKHGNTTLSR